VVSSLTLAEHFRKRHDDVLKAIRNLIRGLPEDFNARNFATVEYLDPKGEKRPAFNLTRDGFTLLAMGFSGAKALAWKVRYIQAFNTMEDRLREKGNSTLLPRQNEGTDRKRQTLFTYKEWKPMTKDKIDGIM
jgi:Rha family phage regulatory protein